MRTEDDLRAALVALEREAPAVTQVLPKASSRNGRGFLPPAGRRWRAVGLAAALGLVVGVSVALVAVLSPAGSLGHQQVSPASEALRAKLLAALSASGGKIVYERTTDLSPGTTAHTVMESWHYPWMPKAGQLERDRELILNTDGTPLRDSQASYMTLAPDQDLYANGKIIDVEYATGTWSVRHSRWLFDDDPGAPTTLWDMVHNGMLTVVGRTELGGHPAIEVRFKIGPGSDYLLIDARTYLPLRTLISKGASVRRYDYQYLQPTAANLAKLTAPIPAGFRRTAQPVTPKNAPPFYLQTAAPAGPAPAPSIRQTATGVRTDGPVRSG
jgi:hypothetical protein